MDTTTYFKEYLKTVKENRSAYGNFMDNAISFDPYKEQKATFDVVRNTEIYDPWGNI
jgi:hypothetical protein